MIELITGVPGAGKTLYTITAVKAKAEREGRQVYYSGIPELALPWIEIDPEKWMECPPNSIVVIDECQRVFRPRSYGKDVPPHVAELETHRHRGLDLFLLTQSPMLVDTNVRRLVGNHKHVTRKFGWKKAVIFEFESCKDQPLSKTEDAQRHDFFYPKSSMGLYKSAEVHTHKARVPWKLVVLLLVPLVLGGAIWWEYGRYKAGFGITESANKAAGLPSGAGAGPVAAAGTPGHVATLPEYVAARTPRIGGLAYTAPMYDEITKPVRAPAPVACVKMGQACRCYTEQATRLEVPPAVCAEIVEKGFFQAWDNPAPHGSEREMRRETRPAAGPEETPSAAPGGPVAASASPGAVPMPAKAPNRFPHLPG